jgi:hypothetical protein
LIGGGVFMSIEEYYDSLENQAITKKEKILLSFPLRPEFIKNTMDYGLGYLYSGLRLAGYDVFLNLEAWSKVDFVNFLSHNTVNAVGLKCYGTYKSQILETIKIIKNINPHIVIIIGSILR